MPIRRPEPIKLSGVASQTVQNQLGVQTTSRVAPKSTDPNFPVFEVPLNKRVLVYVPNHVVDDENGEPTLRMDKPLIHAVQDGKRFLYFRCVNGLDVKDEEGNIIYDGTCPLCEGTSIPWDLANLKIKQKCASLGLDPDDKNNDSVKSVRSAEFSARVLKESNRYFTFPIVVIETEGDDGKTVKKDENGKPVFHPMWYHISESLYTQKWLPTLEGLEDEPTHPGGHFFVLNFIYDTKGKEPNKRDAARNVNVISRTMKQSEKLRSYLDKVTEKWTPEKAQEVVITNQLFSMKDLQDIADKILEGPKDMIALLEAAEASGNAAVADSGFNLTPPEEKKALEQGAVAMDETDEDDTFGDLDLG